MVTVAGQAAPGRRRVIMLLDGPWSSGWRVLKKARALGSHAGGRGIAGGAGIVLELPA